MKEIILILCVRDETHYRKACNVKETKKNKLWNARLYRECLVKEDVGADGGEVRHIQS